jgi:hypothetical protein
MNLETEFSCPNALVGMQGLPRWVVWGTDKKNPKRPYTPSNGSLSPASTDDPSTWGTYADATATAERLGCGVGLVLSPADDNFDVVALDLDKCRDPETGALSPWAKDLVDKAGSYTEITPSGAGLRIIGTGSDIELHCDLPRGGAGHLEVYSKTNRYITVTGKHLNGAQKPLADLSELVVSCRDEKMGQQLSAAAEAHSYDDRKVERLIDELAQPGNWHNSMIRLIGHFIEKGFTDSAIQAIARSWTQPEFTPEQTRKEVQVAIDGARKKGYGRRVGGRDVQKIDELRFFSLEELANEPPPKMLIKDIFPERGVAVLYGASGSMKSFLMITVAMHVALGLDLGDLAVKQQGVLILLNEGQAGFSLRCEAWLKNNGGVRPENIRVAKMTPNLTHDNANDHFIKLAEEMNFRPGLIFIDSFSKATFGGDDNSTSDMAGAMGAADQLAAHFDALIVVVDHAGKELKKGLRGAYAKQANADMVGMVSRFDNRVTLKTIKQKEAEADLEFVFRAAMVDMPIPDDPKHKVPALILDTDPAESLAAAFSQPDFIVRKLDAEGPLTREQLKEAFRKQFGDGKDKSLNEALRRLKKDNKVREDADGFALPN